jgi:hypothetical protein
MLEKHEEPDFLLPAGPKRGCPYENQLNETNTTHGFPFIWFGADGFCFRRILGLEGAYSLTINKTGGKT